MVSNNGRRKLLYGLLTAVILAAIVCAAILLQPRPDDAPQAEPVITYSTDTPDESLEAAEAYPWSGAPDEPKRITIDKIDVDALIQKAGVDQDQKIAVPNNVHLAGWFADSVKPGENGLAIISGHVTGRMNDGVFKQLEQLKVGDTFSVELGNGTLVRYSVIKTSKIKETEAATHLFSQDPSVASQVNLITCGGEYDEASQQYADRVIISGELLT